MGAYIRGRLLRAVPVILGVLTLVFLMIHLLPGDPAVEIASRGPGISPEAIQRIRIQLKLDQPLYIQYFHFIARTAHNDLKQSIITNQAVSTMIHQQVNPTVQLTL